MERRATARLARYRETMPTQLNRPRSSSLIVALLLASCSKETPQTEATTRVPVTGAVSAPSAVAPTPSAAVPSSGSPAPGDAPAHSDHSSKHGGVVTMEGDNHVEIVVTADGTIDLYLTDAVRRPIPPTEATGIILIEPPEGPKQRLPLTADPTKGALSAKGPAGLEKSDYSWELKVRGEPMAMTLRVPKGGTASLVQPEVQPEVQPDDRGAESPKPAHGGLLATVAEHRVEITLNRKGEISVWVPEGKNLESATVSVRPEMAGGRDVPLAFDASTRAFRGQLSAIKQAHLAVSISITRPGGKPDSARVLFDFEAHGAAPQPGKGH